MFSINNLIGGEPHSVPLGGSVSPKGLWNPISPVFMMLLNFFVKVASSILLVTSTCPFS